MNSDSEKFKEFQNFIHAHWVWREEGKGCIGIYVQPKEMDVSGGKISISEIDIIKKYPDADTFTVSGLNQSTFEHLIKNYGNQIKSIRFFKNKLVEDLSLLSELPNLEYMYFFHNQRISKLWDMSKNINLKGIAFSDFTRLKNLSGVEKAPNLRYFSFVDAVWNTNVVDSYMCFANTNLEYLEFNAKNIIDRDFSFLETMPNLTEFHFASKFLSTEEVAWICGNFPKLKGDSLRPYRYFASQELDIVIITGKRKPSFDRIGNEEKLQKYVEKFEDLKIKFKNKSYKQAFPDCAK